MCFAKFRENKLNKENKRRVDEIISDVQNLLNRCSSVNGMSAVAVKINRVGETLGGLENFPSKSQLVEAKRLLNDIKDRFDVDHIDYILAKLDKVQEYMLGKQVAHDNGETYLENNEDRIFELNAKISANRKETVGHIKKLSALNAQINEKEELQKSVIGNKAEWQKYYFEINQLKSESEGVKKDITSCEWQIKVLTQTVESFKAQNRNIQSASVIQQTSSMLADLEEQKSLVDTALISANAKYSKETKAKINKDSEEIGNIINEAYSDSTDSYMSDAELAYEEAVRKASLEKIKPQGDDSSNGDKRHKE